MVSKWRPLPIGGDPITPLVVLRDRHAVGAGTTVGQGQSECAEAAGSGRGGEEVDVQRPCSREGQEAALLADGFPIPSSHEPQLGR